jgi:hypothetical protein
MESRKGGQQQQHHQLRNLPKLNIKGGGSLRIGKRKIAGGINGLSMGDSSNLMREFEQINLQIKDSSIDRGTDHLF